MLVLVQAALVLVALHRIDGGEVVVNASQVTSLRSVPGGLSRQISGGHCLVGLTDGKFVAVMESCGEVRRLLTTPP